MSATREAEWGPLVLRCARQQQTISDLNELIEVVAGEWKNLGLKCNCEAENNATPYGKSSCSVCEISLRLQDWQDERDAEGPQE